MKAKGIDGIGIKRNRAIEMTRFLKIGSYQP